MNEKYEAIDIAHWLLSKNSMSPKKLQKMLYYAYSWVITLTNNSDNKINNRLFDNQFEGWVHGPVLPDIYNKYNDYGFKNIEKFDGKLPKFDDDILDILNQVWNVYGKYSASQLESLTHQETPWKNSRKGLSPIEAGHTKINDRDIFDYYGAMAE